MAGYAIFFFFWQLNMQTVFCEFDLSRPCGVKTTTEMGNIKIQCDEEKALYYTYLVLFEGVPK